MNAAIFVTGTICSGKSTLAERMGKSLNFDVIGEENSNGFFGIINRVKNNLFSSPVIIEHAEIYNLINDKRELEISKYFDKLIIVLLNVSNDILKKNINKRKLYDANKTGDYLKIDMFEMKVEIENHFNQLPDDYIKYIANIKTVDDYEAEYHNILAFVSRNLNSK